jgi:hypothetical protein
MRLLARLLGLVVALVVLVVGLEMVAAESGEVVVLRTPDDAGRIEETRLWVVDDAGHAWLRSGSPAAGWLARLGARPDVEVVREGNAARFRAVPQPDQRERVNALMHEKYGWADAYIGMLFGRDDAVPIRLDPR